MPFPDFYEAPQGPYVCLNHEILQYKRQRTVEMDIELPCAQLLKHFGAFLKLAQRIDAQFLERRTYRQVPCRVPDDRQLLFVKELPYFIYPYFVRMGFRQLKRPVKEVEVIRDPSYFFHDIICRII